jgi:hypothetical protein
VMGKIYVAKGEENNGRLKKIQNEELYGMS